MLKVRLWWKCMTTKLACFLINSWIMYIWDVSFKCCLVRKCFWAMMADLFGRKFFELILVCSIIALKKSPSSHSHNPYSPFFPVFSCKILCAFSSYLFWGTSNEHSQYDASSSILIWRTLHIHCNCMLLLNGHFFGVS